MERCKSISVSCRTQLSGAGYFVRAAAVLQKNDVIQVLGNAPIKNKLDFWSQYRSYRAGDVVLAKVKTLHLILVLAQHDNRSALLHPLVIGSSQGCQGASGDVPDRE